MNTISENRTKSLLYLDGVSVSFDGFRALNSLSFVVEPGELRAIIGPNGAGKTTMMDIITGKTRPDTGTVLFEDSIDLTKRTRRISPSSASDESSRNRRSLKAIPSGTIWNWRSTASAACSRRCFTG